MPQFDFDNNIAIYKIVYYGPGISGKTSNLEYIYQKTPRAYCSDLTSHSTKKIRTLYFELFPPSLGKYKNMDIKLRLFTIPGSLFRDPVRKYTLKNADGVIFVADSQRKQIEQNLATLNELRNGLLEHQMNIETIPIVMQWNKRDMPNICTTEELERSINILNIPSYEAVAATGKGVFSCLEKICSLMFDREVFEMET